MKYFLGIDGGGTKTRFNVIDENNNIIFDGFSGPSSIDTVDLKTTYKNVVEYVNNLPYQFNSIHFGVGGVYTDKDIELLLDLLRDIENVSEDCSISASNDVYNLYSVALGRENGMVVISGTGSVCYGQKGLNSTRIGGYGYKEGDPGSGYSIGLMALQTACKYMDGREKVSKISVQILNSLNIKTYAELGDFVSHLDRTKIASLAKLVLENPNYRDSKKILNKSSDDIVEMIIACKNNLQLDDDFKYALSGGVLHHESFQRLVLNKVNKIYPNARCIDFNNNSAFGAALIAKGNYDEL